MRVQQQPDAVAGAPAGDRPADVDRVVQVAHAALGAPADALVVGARVARAVGVGLDHADVRAVAVGRLHNLELDAVHARIGQHLGAGRAQPVGVEPAELVVLAQPRGGALHRAERVVLRDRAAAQLVAAQVEHAQRRGGRLERREQRERAAHLVGSVGPGLGLRVRARVSARVRARGRVTVGARARCGWGEGKG